MGMFTWNDAYLLGVRLFDSEHRTLFALAHELNEAVIHGENTWAQKNLLNRFVNTLLTHFEHEEELMRHYRYSDLEEHTDEHQELAAQMLKMKQRLEAGAISIPLDFTESVRNWFDRHIRRYDQLAARHTHHNELIGLEA